MSDGGETYPIYQSQVGSDDGYAEVDVFIDVGQHTNRAGPTFRLNTATFTTATNGYGAWLYNDGAAANRHLLGIFRIDSGIPTLLVNTADLTASFTETTTVTVRLDVSGSTLTAYLAGVEELSTTDNTHTAGQYAGFRLWRQGGTATSQPFVDNWEAGDSVAQLDTPNVTVDATTNPATAISEDGTADVSWPAITGAGSYRVELASGLNATTGFAVVQESHATTSIQLTGLGEGGRTVGVTAKP